jgi:putative ABC transport system permease protein
MRGASVQAVRSVLRTPVFTLTAIVILALGIGATTAMFALVSAVLLRDLTYPGAERSPPDSGRTKIRLEKASEPTGTNHPIIA